jgi:hypothetical protein
MKTIAKFVVQKITRHMGSKRVGDNWVPSEMHSYELGAVYSENPNHGNKKFWDASPSGLIQLTTVFPHEVFDLGKELYVIFTNEKPEEV